MYAVNTFGRLHGSANGVGLSKFKVNRAGICIADLNPK
jgi:hypothetical protein